MSKHEFYSFSDESSNHENALCLGFVFCDSIITLRELGSSIQEIIMERGISELKWSKVKYGKDVKAIKKLIDVALKFCENNKIRIISACINKQRLNKEFQSYDDYQLYGFLYYQVIKYVIKQIKLNNVEMKLVHDEGSGFNWENICKYLVRYMNMQNYQEVVYTEEELRLIGLQEAAAYGDMLSDEKKNRFIFVQGVTTKNSNKSPFLQLADIMAGIHGFSHKQNNVHSCPQVSRARGYKMEIMNYLKEKIKGKCYNTSTELSSFAGSNPDFWHFPKR